MVIKMFKNPDGGGGFTHPPLGTRLLISLPHLCVQEPHPPYSEITQFIININETAFDMQ